MPKSKPRKNSTSDSDSGPDDRNEAKKSKPTEKSKPAEKAKPAAAKSSFTDSDELTWEIGRNRSVKLTEFKGKWYVSIREYYMSDGEMKPSKKGIMLTMEQWQKFKNLVPDIEEGIKKNV